MLRYSKFLFMLPWDRKGSQHFTEPCFYTKLRTKETADYLHLKEGLILCKPEMDPACFWFEQTET